MAAGTTFQYRPARQVNGCKIDIHIFKIVIQFMTYDSNSSGKKDGEKKRQK